MTDILHGLHDDLPARCYHRSMGISKSGLDLIHRSPALFDLARQSPRPSTPAQALGTAVHLLVLEPGRALTDVVPDPFGASRSKDALAWRAEQSRKAAEQRVDQSRKSVQQHAEAVGKDVKRAQKKAQAKARKASKKVQAQVKDVLN